MSDIASITFVYIDEYYRIFNIGVKKRNKPTEAYTNKMLSYHRETALQGALALAESRRLELGDDILRILL